MEQLRNLLLRGLELVRTFRAANRQLFILIVAAIGLGLAICSLLYLLNPGAPIILASNLSPVDRTALALRLRRQGIKFNLGPDSISVPSSQIGEARRLLEASPGFSGGVEDFSLFDHSAVGQSDFDEQVNYQRSLQGEIERTLMDIHGVDNARVMLAMGTSSPFGLAAPEAERASVLLTIAPGAVVDGTMARAIAHLVAGSVRGLAADNVTITGNDGAVLYPFQHEGELGEAMRLRNDFERRLQGKVAALLTRIMGENRFAVEVAVDVDTSRVTSEDDLYRRDDQAILSQEHSLTSAAALDGGIPGLTSNLPTASASIPAARPAKAGATAAATPGGSVPNLPEFSRKDIINYKPSNRVIKTVTAPVRIKQITVAAVVDGTYEGGRFRPLPDERLNAIKGLLGAAVGAQQARGDSVEVQSAALSQPYVPPVPNPITEVRAWLNQPVHMFSAVGAGLAALLALIFAITRTLSRIRSSRTRASAAEVEPITQAGLTTLESTSTPLSKPPAESPAANFDAVRSQLNQQVGRDPVMAAEILRKWLNQRNGDMSQAQQPSDNS
jgi:flagellar M-ring protein FliF